MAIDLTEVELVAVDPEHQLCLQCCRARSRYCLIVSERGVTLQTWARVVLHLQAVCRHTLCQARRRKNKPASLHRNVSFSGDILRTSPLVILLVSTTEILGLETNGYRYSLARI